MPPSKNQSSFSTPTSNEAKQNNGSSSGIWQLGDRVLCRYVNSEIYYEAKIISVDVVDGQNIYGIHYQGWNSRHDEKILQTDSLVRFKHYSKDEAEKAKDELKKAQQLLFSKKRKSTATPDKRLDDSSRGSTPSQAPDSSKRIKAPFQKSGVGSAEMVRKPKEIRQIVLPDSLRKILIDDENLINKSMLLLKIPARITIFEIVQQYRNTVNPGCSPREMYIEYSGTEDTLLNPLSEMLDHSALGLLDYFETTIGSLLLYKPERPMFNDLAEKLKQKSVENSENDGETSESKREVCFSKQFGLPHLLRMFVRFSEMLSYTQWTERALDAIIRHAQDFVMFLNKNHADYYDVDVDYQIASPDYHKRVWGVQS